MKNSIALILLFTASAFASPSSADLSSEQSSCVSRTVKNYRPMIDVPNKVDKYKHCTMSCVLAIHCGIFSSRIAGIGKEIQDVFTPGDCDVKDIQANSKGIRLVRQKKAHDLKECSDQCDAFFPTLALP